MRIQLISITALASLTVLSAKSQTAGASAGSGVSVGGPPPVVPALQPRQAVTPPVAPTQLPNGQVPSSTAQQTTPGLGTSTTTTGAGPGAGTTTGLGTGANEISSTTANPTTQDQAVTAADQEVLAQVRQRIIIPGGRPWGPVHFSVANGVVTVTGQAQSPAAQQQLESLVKSTPGVVAVMNQLNSASPTAGTVATTGTTSGTTTAPLNSGGPSLAGAMSPADQILLLRVRQSVVPQIQVAGQPVPVNFTVQQGVVTVNGSVTSLAQKRQIAALVQQVPGVSQVSDQIRVGSTLPQTTLGATGATAAPGQITGPDGNLTPTGRTNGAALPQGLQRRNDLPPGLQRRGALPPGLSEGTNSSGTIR